jgi:hypothetical protein
MSNYIINNSKENNMNLIKTTLAAFLLLSLTTLNSAFAAPKYIVDFINLI